MTTALDLLEETRRALKSELAPSLLGDARLVALMAASAIATAAREFALSAKLSEAEAALPEDIAAIRRGDHDEDEALYGRILAAAVLRAHIADPSGPTEKEREIWIGDRAA